MLSSPRYTPSGFELCSPPCDGKAQGPPSQRWGRTQQLGVGGCCTRNRAARLETSIALSPFCAVVAVVVLLLLLLLCSGGTGIAAPGRSQLTSHPGQVQPAPVAREVVVMVVVVVGLRGPIWPLCRVGYLGAAGIMLPRPVVVPHLDA